MLIRELSEKTGASIRSIRHYEAKGLISANRRSNGYRDYDDSAIHRIKTIQLYLSLGLTTDSIAQIIDCRLAPTNDRPLCREAYNLYKAKLAEINKQIELLSTIQTRLAKKIGEFETEGLL